MAQFNPENPSQNPNYLGYSKGSIPDVALAGAITDTTQTANAAIDYGNQHYDYAIQKDVRKNLGPIQDAYLNILSSPMGMGADETPAPGALTRRLDNLTDRSDAVKTGQLRESHYRLLLDAEARALRAQYPGFTDVVDRHVANLVGGNPANQAINELYQEAKAGATSTQKTYDFWWKEAIEKTNMGPAFVARRASGDVPSVEELQMAVAKQSAFHAETENNRSRLSLESATDAAKVTRAKAALSKEASGNFNTMILAPLGPLDKFQKTLADVGKNAGPLGDIAPGDRARLDQAFNQLKQSAEDVWNHVFTRVDSNGFSYSNVLVDKKDWEGIKASQMAKLDALHEAIYNKETGLVGAIAARLDNEQKNDALHLMETQRWLRVVAAVKELGGGQFIAANAFTEKLTGDAAKLFKSDVAVRAIAPRNKEGQPDHPDSAVPGPDSLGRVIDDAKRNNNGHVDVKQVKDIIDTQSKVLTDKNTTPEMFANAAEHMFGPANMKFLDAFDPKSQKDLYMRFVGDPAIADKMMALKGTAHDDVYQMYKKWAITNFHSQMVKSANDVQSIVTTSLNNDLSYDPETFSFSVRPNPNPNINPNNPLNLFDKYVSDPSRIEAVNDLNKITRTMATLVSKDGKDPNLVIHSMLNDAGINLGAKKEGPVLVQLARKINDALGTDATEKPGSTPKGAEVKQGSESTPSKLLQGIGQAESGQEGYNSVFGQKGVTLTDKSLNEVYALQKGMKTSTAVGKYQFLNSTVRRLANKLGFDPDTTKFTSYVQDEMAKELLRERGLNDYITGKISKMQFATNLSKEWAALPNPETGRSSYAGDGLNKAQMTREQLYSLIDNGMEGLTGTTKDGKKWIFQGGKWQIQ